MNSTELQRQMDKEERVSQNDQSLPQPDWSAAPSGASWWAVDEDGTSWWYQGEPIQSAHGDGDGYWADPQDDHPTFDAVNDGVWGVPCGAWMTTLRKRPEEADVAPSLQPDWSAAPDWAIYWAVDEDGCAYWYQNQPGKSGSLWSRAASGGHSLLFDGVDLEDRDWMTTLRKRPEAQPAPDQHIQAYQAVERLHDGWVLPDTLRSWAVELLGPDSGDEWQTQLEEPKRQILLTELQRLQPYLRPDATND